MTSPHSARDEQSADDEPVIGEPGDEMVASSADDEALPPLRAPRQPVAGEQLQRIVEGALLAAGRPLNVSELAGLFEDMERPDNDSLRAALVAIGEACQGRGFELKEVASGFRFQVVQEVAPWIGRLWDEKPQRYSRALLETLALIAYRQPITRGDIEDIRGVAVASNIVKTLLERDWVRVVGHKDVPGRPAMYATTRKFLDYFNLKNLDDLPALAEIRDLDTLNAELALEGADTPAVDAFDGAELAADAAVAAAEAAVAGDDGTGPATATGDAAAEAIPVAALPISDDDTAGPEAVVLPAADEAAAASDEATGVEADALAADQIPLDDAAAMAADDEAVVDEAAEQAPATAADEEQGR